MLPEHPKNNFLSDTVGKISEGKQNPRISHQILHLTTPGTTKVCSFECEDFSEPLTLERERGFGNGTGVAVMGFDIPNNARLLRTSYLRGIGSNYASQ
jgi:hypothetical protein